MSTRVEMSISFGPSQDRVRLLYPDGTVYFFDVRNIFDLCYEWKQGCTSRKTQGRARKAILLYNQTDLFNAKYEFIGYL